MDKKIICHNCKSILPPGSSYCMQCGAKVTASDYYAVDNRTQPVNPVYLVPGTILHDKYRINSVIGQGGFGITYDGTDITLGMHVAIKEYFPGAMATRRSGSSNEVSCGENTVSLYGQGLNNFLKEARNMAKFAGEENFVSVHDYFAENNTAYIIMEYVQGRNLKEYLQERGHLSYEESMTIAVPVMNALEKIHARGMIHRDVSPSNIMIMSDGRIKLLDFGAAREMSLDPQGLTTMSAVYKYGYSPIEQLTRDMPQGPYSDIYALCATIYEMLTGSTPPSPFARLQNDTLLPPSQLGVRITPGQEAALMQGLAIYGVNRIQTIGELRAALLSSAPYPRSGGFVPGAGDGSGRRTIVAALGVLASLLTILLIFLVYRAVSSRTPTHTQSDLVSSVPSSGGDAAAAASAQDSVSGESPEESGQDNGSGDVQSDTAGVDEQEAAEFYGGDAAAASRVDDSRSDNSNAADTASSEADEVEAAPKEAATDEAAAQTENKADAYPADALYYNGHHYYIYHDDAKTWTEAMGLCIDRGGYLAVVNDADENEMLFQYMLETGHEQAFFGLTDSFEEDDWVYIYGDTSDFRDWGTNSHGRVEPNNAEDGEDFAEFDANMHDGHWNDATLGYQAVTPEGENYKDIYTYICEWDF